MVVPQKGVISDASMEEFVENDTVCERVNNEMELFFVVDVSDLRSFYVSSQQTLELGLMRITSHRDKLEDIKAVLSVIMSIFVKDETSASFVIFYRGICPDSVTSVLCKEVHTSAQPNSSNLSLLGESPIHLIFFLWMSLLGSMVKG